MQKCSKQTVERERERLLTVERERERVLVGVELEVSGHNQSWSRAAATSETDTRATHACTHEPPAIRLKRVCVGPRVCVVVV